MVERWKAAGMPMGSVSHRFSKRGWDRIVGGILDVAGEVEFLGNCAATAAEFDRTRQDVAELVGTMTSLPKESWTAADLVNTAEAANLLKIDIGEGSARSKATRMGIILSRFIGEEFTYGDGRSVTLTKESKGNNSEYHAKPNW